MTANPAVPEFAELQAPVNCRTADFISDLHLQVTEPETFEAWRRYMAASPADVVFILGDLFEAWVGDDAAVEPGFAFDCAAVLQAAAAIRPVFFMHGNRDFLVGESFLRGCGITLLADPTVFGFAGQRWLLTHGDALCLDDVDYMKFRALVRSTAWQQDFLAKPLAERRAIAREMRGESESRKLSAIEYADVDSLFSIAWLAAADAHTMIHGHTHKPADHVLGDHRRIVLSDWDAMATPARLQALRLTAAGTQRVALT